MTHAEHLLAKITNKNATVGIIGLGYVGLPLLHAMHQSGFPVIGYDRATEIARRAYAEGRPVKDVAAEMTDLSGDELERLLDPLRLTRSGR